MPALDGVRGVAIAMVLALHFVGDTTPSGPLDGAVVRACNFGMYGVDLFFVLSGFLITGILFDAKDEPDYFRSFYTRRALRIFPLYYAVLAAVFVVLPNLREQQVWAWLYGVNVLDAARGVFSFGYLNHFWSLCVEEHFYFFWPLVVWSCSRRTLLRVAAAVVACSLGSRMVLAELGALSPLALYVLTPFRLDSLGLGALLALWVRRPGGLDAARDASRWIVGVTLALFTTSWVYNLTSRTGWAALHELRSTLFSVLFTVLVARALGAPGGWLARAMRQGWLRRLGKYSYGLYVFHHFASYYLQRHGIEWKLARHIGSHSLAVLVQASAGFAVSLAVAIASFHLFESPVMGLRRRLLRPRPAAASRAVPT
jgi:peptidoglycan/LPS O-acetylase OafA/YrhL